MMEWFRDKFNGKFDPNVGVFVSPPLKDLPEDCYGKIEFGRAMQLANFNFRAGVRDFGRMLALALYGEILGEHPRFVRYPKTWWDAFKVRWFPKVVLKKFPPEYVEEQMAYVCPHVELPQTDKAHFDFVKGV